ncbi:MAG: hypothetical protein ACOYB8_00670 [Eubacteriaceae bacterium]|jgi:hypothetical protein
MQLTNSTNINEIHDQSLIQLQEMILHSDHDRIKTLSTAEGIAKELYQIEIISPDEYHLISRYIKRALRDPSSVTAGEYPQFAMRNELRPVTISDKEIQQIQRVVPQEIRRDLTRCFRKEDIPFIHGLEGRVQTLLNLGLIAEDQGRMLMSSFNDKKASFN